MSGRRSSNKGARTERATRLLLGHGLPRPVIALTETKATILAPSGASLMYRRHNKPALGPLGDSLNDFAPRSRAHFGSVV